MERKFIGKGYEHRVVESTKPGLVLKRPRILQALLCNASDIQEEYSQAMTTLPEHNVMIPKSRIIPFGRRGYVIAQEKITHDHSVDILTHLRQNNLDELADRHERNPTNFMSQNGIVYWLDPAIGLHKRFDNKVRSIIESFRNATSSLLSESPEDEDRF